MDVVILKDTYLKKFRQGKREMRRKEEWKEGEGRKERRGKEGSNEVERNKGGGR